MPVLKMQIREADKGKLTTARVHIKDEKGRYYYPDACIRYEKDGHFTVDGQFEVLIPSGKVSILVEKGKEYRSLEAELVMRKGEDHHVECHLYRWINMAERGWYSGDLHIHRPIADMEHLIRAEDLNVAPVITVWNDWHYWNEYPDNKVIEVDKTHAYGILTQEDERKGGAVLMFSLNAPVDLGLAGEWYPPSFAYCRSAHERGAIVDQEKPFWWEAPINVALGGVDTIGILNNHMQREGIMDNEAWGKPRDTSRYPGCHGFIENVLNLYYHYLNLGLKLPISAGSASGVLSNPVGYNRLYVHLGRSFNYEKWFRGMKAGLAFATNGPMLFFSINNCELGETLRISAGKEFRGKAEFSVCSQAEIDRVEIVYNGEIIHEFSGNGSSELTREFDIRFSESGWVSARAFEKNDKTIRFAHTNPIYIEIGSPMKPRLDSARYYMDWCNELLSASSADRERYQTSRQREEVESLYRRAIAFYQSFLR